MHSCPAQAGSQSSGCILTRERLLGGSAAEQADWHPIPRAFTVGASSSRVPIYDGCLQNCADCWAGDPRAAWRLRPPVAACCLPDTGADLRHATALRPGCPRLPHRQRSGAAAVFDGSSASVCNCSSAARGTATARCALRCATDACWAAWETVGLCVDVCTRAAADDDTLLQAPVTSLQPLCRA